MKYKVKWKIKLFYLLAGLSIFSIVLFTNDGVWTFIGKIWLVLMWVGCYFMIIDIYESFKNRCKDK
jgi:hypothetical protein